MRRATPTSGPLSVLLALVAVLGFTAPVAAFQALPYESPAVALDGDGSAELLAAGDVDGDGFDDLVTRRFLGAQSPAMYEVVVQFGLSTPGIGPRRTVVDERVGQIVLADLDGDGAREILLLSNCTDCAGYTHVRVFRCVDRNFELEATILPVFFPWGTNVLNQRSVAAGDFDGDGDLDLAVSQDAGIVLQRNDGGWSFAPADKFELGGAMLVGGDFDGNGRDDFAARMGAQVRMVLFDGAGFANQSYTTTVPGTNAIELAAGDLDGDGADEIVRLASPGGRIDVWSGTLGLVPRATIASTSGTNALSVGDVDGDGLRDLVVTAQPTQRFVWHENEGGFAFASEQSRATGGSPTALAWSDVDLDGRLDPLVANTLGVAVVAYPSDGVVTGTSSSHASAADPSVVEAGDIDGDGRRDFASLSAAANLVTVRRTMPDFTTRLRTDVPIEPLARDLLLADLDLDGAADLVTAHAGSPSRVLVRIADGAGGFAAPIELSSPPAPLALAAADLDLDGKPDLVVLSGAASVFRVHRGDGNGGFVAHPDVVVGSQSSGLLLHELNGAGRPDVLVTSSATGEFTLYRGLPGAGIAFAADGPHSVPGGADVVDLVDADHDGRLDLVFGGSFGGGPTFLRALGDGEFAAGVELGASDHVQALHAADVDGDGHGDLVALSPGFGGSVGPGSVHVLRGNGDGTFAASLAFVTVDGPKDLALADVTGDGRLDILVSSFGADAVQLAPNLSSGSPVGVPPTPVPGAGIMLSIAPSPSVGPLRVSFVGRPQAPVRVDVYGVDGRKVGAGYDLVSDVDGRVSLVLPAPGRAGVYLVRAAQDGRVAVKRAVVLE